MANRRILVPMDDSPQSETALRHALEVHPDASITVLGVIDFVEATYSIPPANGPQVFWDDWYEDAREETEERQERAKEIAAEYDREIDTAIETGNPSRVIVEYADEHDVDQIVMGSHGRRGASRILLGSVAESVMRRSHVPVTIAR